jgi:integrase
MPSSALTDFKISSSAGPCELWDTRLPGFGVRVGAPSARSPKGKKTWQVMYRVAGRKKHRFKIGTYPTIGLAEARDEARRLLAQVQRGIDPKHEAVQAAEDEEYTVERLAKEYIERDAKRRNRRWQDKENQLNFYVLPRWGRRPVTSVTTRDVIKLNDEMVEVGAATARNVYALVRHMFGWAVERQLLQETPCTVKSPPPLKSRERILAADEVAAIWHALPGYPFGPLMKLLFLTAQRRTNISRMKWAELDLEKAEWIIPGESHKSKREHLVPLTEAAVEVLGNLPQAGEFVFSGRVAADRPFSGFSKSKKRLDVASGVDNWRLHDIRRTVATMMQEIGIAPHVIEAVEGRVSGSLGGVAGVYQRYGYDREKREALEALSGRLLELIGERSPSNVIRLTKP